MSIVTAIRKQRDAWRAPKPKAASDYKPELAERQHLTSSYAGAQAAEIADSFVDYASTYRSYVWVRKAIRLTAQNIAPLPVRVVDEGSQPLHNHPVSQLLARGNDTAPPANIWDNYVVAMLLSGESPLEIVDDRAGRPLWLWPRRPDLVFVRPDTNPERANYPTVAEYLVMPDATLPAAKPLAVPVTNMIFDKFDNPLNVWRGISPASAVRESIMIDIYAQTWAKRFFQKGARPEFAIIAQQGLTRTERDQIEQDFMYQHGGMDNWTRPPVLESGATDIKTFSFPPRDMEWVQQREFARDEVGAMYGVPDELMGWGKDTYENMDFALRYFWTMTLRPLIEHRDMVLTHFFTTKRPMLVPGQRVVTDLSSVGVLQEDKAPKVDMASKLFAMGVPFNQLDTQLQLGVGPIDNGDYARGEAPAPTPTQDSTAQEPAANKDILGYHIESGVVTVNEARADIGLPPIDDAQGQLLRTLNAKLDTLIKATQAGIPIDQAAPMVGLEVTVPEPPLPPVQAPPPPIHDEPTNEPPDVEDMPDEMVDDEAQKGAATAHGFFTWKPAKITRKNWLEAKALVLQTMPDDDDAEETLRVAVEQRSAEAIRRALRRQWRELLPPNADTMSFDELMAYINAHLLPQRTQDAIARTVMDGVDLGVNIALDQLGQAGMSFDYTMVNTRARDWAQQYAGELIRQVDQTTKESVRQSVARWYENGEPISVLRRELEPTFGPTRALVIAQTETTFASARGAVTGYKESGVVEGMIWKTVRDEIVCAICGELDGKMVGLDDRFWDILPDELKKRYKRTFTTPAAHPRCRCRLKPKVIVSNAN